MSSHAATVFSQTQQQGSHRHKLPATCQFSQPDSGVFSQLVQLLRYVQMAPARSQLSYRTPLLGGQGERIVSHFFFPTRLAGTLRPQGSKPGSCQALPTALSPVACAVAVWSHFTPKLVMRLSVAGVLICAHPHPPRGPTVSL